MYTRPVYHTTMTSIYNPSDSFREAASYMSQASSLNSVPNSTKLEVLSPSLNIARSMPDAPLLHGLDSR